MLFLSARCIPETPSFLLYTQQDAKAAEALHWLRGEEDAEDIRAELFTIAANVRRMREESTNCKKVVVPQLLRPLALMCGLMFFSR